VVDRVGRALLTFRGREYRLRPSAGDGTAIHGTAREFPWDVAAATSTCLEAAFDSRRYTGVNSPCPFTATVRYWLSGHRLTITTLIRNQHDEPIPVGLGHHPYFTRALAGPGDEARLELPFNRYFVLEQALPHGPPVPVERRVDFRSPRPLGGELIDDCLTERARGAPIRISYPASGREVTFGASDVFTHAVVYVPVGGPYFAVEPVTNANDAFRLHEDGTPQSGLVVLAPGEGLRGSIWLDVTA
jgi:aldose 1-epimerase